ncbi:MAG: arylesterase [Candidatus Omnitrophota bacterium]|jgi:lysophospholipase L1-like esterase|nr:MAG: arylesterase [Candidatus Omnitrophota bacterium]
MKINTFVVAIVGGLVVILSSGCAKREIANTNSKGKNIICFGDSITAGYGVSPGQDYPAQLSRLLRRPVINAGNSGETSRDALQRLGPDVLENDPFLVIIEFGGNDFLKKIPVSDTVTYVREMVEKIQSQGAMVAIADVSSAMVMGECSKELSRLSKKYQVIFIPRLMAGILTTPSLKSDFIHPNAEGYTLIAERVYKYLKPYLEKNVASR